MYRYYLYHPDLKKPVRLKHDPVGWDSMNKKFIRDRVTHGIFFGYTPKIKFIKDGKAIIHTLYEVYGPEAEITIIIKIRDKASMTWMTDYTGRLNLGTLSISSLYAECNIEQTGFVQKFKNRQDVKVDIQNLVDLDGNAITPFTNETREISLHGKELTLQFEGEGTVANVEFTANKFGTGYLQFPLVARNDEIEQRIDYAAGISSEEPTAVRKYNWKVKFGGLYFFNIHIFPNVVSEGGWNPGSEVNFYLKYGRPNAYTTITIGTSVWTAGLAIPFDATLIQDITLQENDEVYVFGTFPIDAIAEYSYLYQTYNIDGPLFLKSSVSVSGATTYAATNSEIVLMHEAAARICQSITGVADPLRSDYYGRTDSEPNTYDADGKGSLRGFAPGFWVRGFPKTEKSLHMSLKELMSCLATIDGVGFGIETIENKQYVVMAPLSYFYRDTEILQVNNCQDITKSVAEDYYYNELEIGYRKWTVTGGAVNHLDEFNSRREYSLPIMQFKNKLSLISPYIAGGYALETTRRENVFRTKDNENDNEVFIIQLKRNGVNFETAKNENFDSMEGVFSPETVYNADLSPGRCLIRNGALIRSFLEKQKDKSLRLTLAEGNSDMVSKRTDETTTVNEGADVLISTLDRPLWLPELYRFKAPLTTAQMAALTASPYGYVSFSESRRDHKKCFILEAERDAKTRLVTFTGLKANL